MAEEKKPIPSEDFDRIRESVREDRERVRKRDEQSHVRTPERKIHDVVDTAPPPDPIKKK